MRNIILCGFMGCGKTTVGKELSTLTGRPFIDMDAFIEKEAAITVSEIFGRYGEADFRRREREACVTLAAQQGLIIASGGGALTFPENVSVLTASGDIVLLDTPLLLILQRLKGDTSRPLLARPDWEAAAEELYGRRMPLYRAASNIVVNAEETPEKAARAICRALGVVTG